MKYFLSKIIFLKLVTTKCEYRNHKIFYIKTKQSWSTYSNSNRKSPRPRHTFFRNYKLTKCFYSKQKQQKSGKDLCKKYFYFIYHAQGYFQFIFDYREYMCVCLPKSYLKEKLIRFRYVLMMKIPYLIMKFQKCHVQSTEETILYYIIVQNIECRNHHAYIQTRNSKIEHWVGRK